MKSIKKLIIYPFITWLFLMLPSHFTYADEEIIFAIGLPKGHELFKVGEEVLAAIASRMGQTLKLVSIPSKRSATLLKNNEIHAELVRSGEYQGKVPFAIKITEPIINIGHYAYSLKSDLLIDGWDSLKAYRSVALRGGWLIEIHMEGGQVTWVDSMRSAFQFLKKGRADICITSAIQADQFLATTDLNVSGIQRLEPAINFTRHYTYFAENYPQLASRYEAALISMKEDGTYQAILSKLRI